MKEILILNKKEGETPLRVIDRFRLRNKKYKDIKMTYAGRLDPMARGLLLVLAGDEVKNKEKYLYLKKEYKFEILFGVSADTFDVLGKVKLFNPFKDDPVFLRRVLIINLKKFTGAFSQRYPLYSSKTVKGKPLFSYGRNNKDVEIPKREVFVSSLKFNGLKKISNKKLLANLEKRIGRVEGDFRQVDILKTWRRKLSKPNHFFIGSFYIKCSGGTYVRAVANDLGSAVGVPALAFSIKRTKIGKFDKMQ